MTLTKWTCPGISQHGQASLHRIISLGVPREGNTHSYRKPIVTTFLTWKFGVYGLTKDFVAGSLTVLVVYKNNINLFMIEIGTQRTWGIGLPAWFQCGLQPWPICKLLIVLHDRDIESRQWGFRTFTAIWTLTTANVCPFFSNSCLLPLTKMLVQKRLRTTKKMQSFTKDCVWCTVLEESLGRVVLQLSVLVGIASN